MTIQEVYIEYRHPLLRWARRRFGDDLAEDIVQETFVQLVRNWSKVEMLNNLRRWLYGVAKYVGSHMLRAMAAVKRGGDLVIEWTDEVADTVAESATQGLSLYVEQLRAHFAGLGPAQRAALDSLAEGNTAAEFAQHKGLNATHVRATVALARKRLCEKLGDRTPYVWVD